MCAMKFESPRCPKCGNFATGTIEYVPGVALLVFEEEGDPPYAEYADYQGETEMDWDLQDGQPDEEGRVRLFCRPCCHEWPSKVEGIDS